MERQPVGVGGELPSDRPMIDRDDKPEKRWVVICASIYPKDVERLERLKKATRASGDRHASKSSVIRDALEHYERCLGLDVP